MMNLIDGNLKDTYALRQIPEKFGNNQNHLLRKKKKLDKQFAIELFSKVWVMS